MAMLVSDADPMLKEAYEGVVRETINQNVVAFKVLDESDRPWAGRHVRFPAHTSRNSGVGARAENATLPTAGQQGYDEVRITSTYQYGRFSVSGQAMKSSKNAFAEALSSELQGITDDLINDLGRQTHGTGDGRLAQMTVASATTTTVLLQNRFGEPGQPGARFCSQNLLVDIGTVASPTANGSSQTVSTVSIAQSSATTADTLTMSAAVEVTATTGVFLFRQGSGGAGVEMLGLQAIIDDFTASNYWGSNAFFGSALQNVNRASVSTWNSIILGNGGTERSPTAQLIQQGVDRIHIESGHEVDFFWAHHEVIRSVFNELASDRRFVADGKGLNSFDGGFSSPLTYGGVPIIRDRHSAYNTLFFGRREALKMYTLCDVGFADDDGSILSRESASDVYTGYIRCYKNLACDTSPNQLGAIRDLR